MGANAESFSKPAIRIIYCKSLVDFHQFFFNDELLIVNHDDLIVFLLLIQSNAEYGTASAITFHKDADTVSLIFYRF